MVSTNNFLYEMDVYLDGRGEVTQRFCTDARGLRVNGYVYLPVISEGGSLELSIRGKGQIEGSVESSAGVVRLNNADGRLDYLLTSGWDGRRFIVREQIGDSYPESFPIRFAGTVTKIEKTDTTITLELKSLLRSLLDRPLSEATFAGTNNNTSQYLEGSVNLKDTGKPLALGYGGTFNVSPILVNETYNLYQISCDPVMSPINAHIGRVAQTLAGSYLRYEDLIQAATSGFSGANYKFCTGSFSYPVGDIRRGAYLLLGTTPTKAVTVDVLCESRNTILNSEMFTAPTYTRTGVSLAGSKSVFGEALQMVGVTETSDTSRHIIAATPLFTTGEGLLLANSVAGVASCFVEPIDGQTYTLAVATRAVGLGTIDYDWAVFAYNNGSWTLTTNRRFGGAVVTPIEPIYMAGGIWKLAATFQSLDGVPTSVAVGFYNSGTSYVGNPSNSSYFGGLQFSSVLVDPAQVNQTDFIPPYKKTGATLDTLPMGTAAHILWRVLRNYGYVLDEVSIIQANASRNYQHSYYTANAKGDSFETLLTTLLASIGGFLEDDGERFYIRLFTLPQTGDSYVLELDDSVLLGSSKRRYLSANSNGGVPYKQITVEFEKNYTIQKENDVFGASETVSVPFTSQEYRRVSTDVDTAIVDKHKSSLEYILRTSLVAAADAAEVAAREKAFFGAYRELIEVVLPSDLAFDLTRGSVVKDKGKLYVVTSLSKRMPSANKEITTGVVTVQLYGGVPA